MPIYALCDANNFYCSCERVFNPKLRGVPVVVLSNNDGCCIARSQEAKDLGIKMGDPWFKIEKWAVGKGVRAYSSNYVLYGDMSRRLYEILQRFSPRVEPYSIDEMFLDLNGFDIDLVQYGREVRSTVLAETDIPTCVGIGDTKTKAKLANFVAKKRPEFGGVCDLRDPAICEGLYPTIPLDEVWGIGRASAAKLQKLGLETVADLARYDITQGRNLLTVTGARVIMELQGTSCLPLTMMAPQRKGLAVTRTFGEAMPEWDGLAEAVATFATRAGEKLRQHGLLACVMTVFIQTNRFVPGEYYGNQATFGIEPTQDSLCLVRDALRGVRSIFRRGYRYWKAGVMLNELIDATTAPAQMFPTRDPLKSASLMAAMDGINARFGRGMLRPAVSGIDRKWTAKAEKLSPRYTTCADEFVCVRA
jgi:DNA polymerase V